MDKQKEIGEEVLKMVEKVGAGDFLVFFSLPREGPGHDFYVEYQMGEGKLVDVLGEAFDRNEELRQMVVAVLLAHLKASVLEDKLKGHIPGAKA